MTDVNPQPARGLGRRALLRNGLLTGLGAAVASVALPGLTGVAQAATTITATPPWPYAPTEIFPGSDGDGAIQPQWWWCKNCSALFWSASGSAAGVCPASYPYAHDPSSSSDYYMVYKRLGEEDVQVGWRWCNWCQGLFFGPNQGTGATHCPGSVLTRYPFTTGPHNLGSGTDYDLLYGGWIQGNTPLQSNWLWCRACQGLFWAGSGVNAGLCPVNFTSQHQGGKSSKYQLFHK